MVFIRQYLAPLMAVIIFVLALVAVSARIFLPDDMAAPAPITPITQMIQTAPAAAAPAQLEPAPPITIDQMADLPDSLSTLLKGTPDDRAL